METIVAYWTGLASEVQAALIGAAATALTATVGALVVVWQIGKQARLALDQNRLNDAMKLKLQVYEEVIELCRKALEPEADLYNYIQQFGLQVSLFKQGAATGIPWPVPKARAIVLNEKFYALHQRSTDMIGITERWQIIEPRMDLFRLAVNVALEDFRTAFMDYFNLCVRLMPVEKVDPPNEGALLPWGPPDEKQTQELAHKERACLSALSILGDYISDIQVELQNLLLADLFKQTVPRREPLDPKLKVIRLDRYEELSSYFNRDTAWGRRKSEAEAKFRSAQPNSAKGSE